MENTVRPVMAPEDKYKKKVGGRRKKKKKKGHLKCKTSPAFSKRK